MTPQRAYDTSRYLVEVCERRTGRRFDIDAAKYGNETRFINDYTGIAPQPNVAFVLHYAAGAGEVAVSVVTQRLIQPGDAAEKRPRSGRDAAGMRPVCGRDVGLRPVCGCLAETWVRSSRACSSSLRD